MPRRLLGVLAPLLDLVQLVEEGGGERPLGGESPHARSRARAPASRSPWWRRAARPGASRRAGSTAARRARSATSSWLAGITPDGGPQPGIEAPLGPVEPGLPGRRLPRDQARPGSPRGSRAGRCRRSPRPPRWHRRAAPASGRPRWWPAGSGAWPRCRSARPARATRRPSPRPAARRHGERAPRRRAHRPAVEQDSEAAVVPAGRDGSVEALHGTATGSFGPRGCRLGVSDAANLVPGGTDANDRTRACAPTTLGWPATEASSPLRAECILDADRSRPLAAGRVRGAVIPPFS